MSNQNKVHIRIISRNKSDDFDHGRGRLIREQAMRISQSILGQEN